MQLPEIIASARRVLGRIDLDPASSAERNLVVGARRYFDLQDRRIAAGHWGGVTCGCPQRVWLNPPADDNMLTGMLIAKLFEQIDTGNVLAAVALLNGYGHCTDASWFRLLWELTLCVTADGSMIAYYGRRPSDFATEFERYGPVVHRANRMPVWAGSAFLKHPAT